MKEERTAALLVSETFCLALVSDTFGCNKVLGAIELSSQYLSKDLQIYISRNGVHLYCKRICMQNIEISKNVFESERYFEFVDIKCFRDYLVKLRLGFCH